MKIDHAGNRKRGAILGLVLIVMLVVTTLGSGLLASNQVAAVEVSKAVSAAQAFWTAEAGLEYVKAIIVKNPITAFELMDAFDGDGVFVGTIDGHGFSVNYSTYVNTNYSYKITSRGTSRGGVVRQVDMDATLLSVAKYAEAWNLSGKAPGYSCRFHDLDKFDGDGVGEAYFNGPLKIDGYPEFEIPVIMTDDKVLFSDPLHRPEDDPAVFKQGITRSADSVKMLDVGDPGYVDFMAVAESAADEGLSLNGDHAIVFYDNGTLTYQTLPPTGPLMTYDLSTGTGVVYVDGDVEVSGEVRGKVTLAVSSDILIIGDITYASATAVDHSDIGFNKMAITDVLGLIAGDSVLFSMTLPEVNIHASIVITEGLFGREGPTGVFNGSINLFGGVIRYKGGGDHPNFEGVKNYLYDRRMAVSPPPSFPATGYEYGEWRQTH